jgi:hypothetical protein
MRRELLLGALAVLVSGLLTWLLAGNPPRYFPRLNKDVELADDSHLKGISESP